MTKTMTAQEWHDSKFTPWKRAMEAYMRQRGEQMARLQGHLGELQTIVAMLMDGRTRQAMTAWNALQLQPKLVDLRLSKDGETVVLVPVRGQPITVTMDAIIGDLQGMLDGDAGEGANRPSPAPAAGS